jgi:crossover junction endodeoxyribonuclease RuvC
MIILGIDPGYTRIGYGVLEKEAGKTTFVDAGILRMQGTDPLMALHDAKREIDALIQKTKPSLFVIEKLFFAQNQKTALQVAQVRGALILSALEHEIPVREFSPNEIKLGVTGYGFADKKAVLKMVKLTLRMPELKVIDDASDALAIALFACNLRG